MQKNRRNNDVFKYILVVIDCLSPYTSAYPLKTKKPSEVVKAFQKIYNNSNQNPTFSGLMPALNSLAAS